MGGGYVTEAELLQILARGEDSRHQFKRDETNADSIAAELAAFANCGGGMLFFGVGDDGGVVGLDAASVRRLNQLLSNAASQNVRPPIHPTTENIQTAQGTVIVVTVPDGLSKPYLDNQGRIWVKNGSDKRRGTARPPPPAHCTHSLLGKRSAQVRINEPSRMRQGSKPDGRDSARGAGRSPRTRQRNTGT